MPSDPDAALAAVARRQFGCWTRGQALALGVPRRRLDAHLASGRVRYLLPGVLVAPTTPDSWERRAMAALLWVGGEAVLARRTAARVHGLPVADDGRLHLLVRNRSPAPSPGLVVHRTRRLEQTDTAARGPLRATTATRTLCDLAGELGPVALRAALAHAVRSGDTRPPDLRSAARRLGRMRGKRALLALVDELAPLDADCASELETRFLRVVRAADLEPTAMNHAVVDADGRRRRIDAVWLPDGLAVELDSERHHGSLLDWHDDLRRADALRRTGQWPVLLRFGWHDVVARPADVVQRVRGGLRRASAHAHEPIE